MPRSPIISLVESYNALSEVEQKVFLDLVDPQPEPEPAVKTRKKRGPSKKAQSLSAVISKTPKVENGAESTDGTDGPRCGVCSNTEDYFDHSKPSPHYHEFEAPKAKKASAQK